MLDRAVLIRHGVFAILGRLETPSAIQRQFLTCSYRMTRGARERHTSWIETVHS